MIPPLRTDGTLPPGIHFALDWNEVRARWGGNRRRDGLLGKLRAGLENLRDAGVPWVLLDGSFTTDKADPNDVDGCWEWTPQVDLSAIDLSFVRLTPADRQHIKTRYGMDFFIADMIEGGSGEPFSSFLQKARDGSAKGVVRLNLNTL